MRKQDFFCMLLGSLITFSFTAVLVPCRTCPFAGDHARPDRRIGSADRFKQFALRRIDQAAQHLAAAAAAGIFSRMFFKPKTFFGIETGEDGL